VNRDKALLDFAREMSPSQRKELVSENSLRTILPQPHIDSLNPSGKHQSAP
jgi:hypothetical protein